MNSKGKVRKDFSKLEEYCKKHHLSEAFDEIPIEISQDLENNKLGIENIQCYRGSFIVVETPKSTEIFFGSNIKELHLGARTCKDYYDSLLHMMNYKEEYPGLDEFEKFDQVLQELLTRQSRMSSFSEDDIVS